MPRKLADLVLEAALVMAALMTCAWSWPTLDAKDDAVARNVYVLVQSGDIAALQAMSGPELHSPEAEAQFQQARKLLPAGRPRSIKTVGFSYFNVVGGARSLQVTQEYDYGDRVVLLQTALSKPSDAAAWIVRGFHVNVATLGQLAVNDLTLQGKSPIQYAFLTMTLLSPILMIAALVKVIRTDGLRRKWLWGILAFFGLCLFRMDWTNGQIEPVWLSVQLLGAGIVRDVSRFSPWIMTFTFPLGALLILTGVWANPKRAKVRPLRTAPAGS